MQIEKSLRDLLPLLRRSLNQRWVRVAVVKLTVGSIHAGSSRFHSASSAQHPRASRIRSEQAGLLEVRCGDPPAALQIAVEPVAEHIAKRRVDLVRAPDPSVGSTA